MTSRRIVAIAFDELSVVTKLKVTLLDPMLFGHLTDSLFFFYVRVEKRGG